MRFEESQEILLGSVPIRAEEITVLLIGVDCHLKSFLPESTKLKVKRLRLCHMGSNPKGTYTMPIIVICTRSTEGGNKATWLRRTLVQSMRNKLRTKRSTMTSKPTRYGCLKPRLKAQVSERLTTQSYNFGLP